MYTRAYGIRERVGDVPDVVLSCAALVEAAIGRIKIYYGAASTVTCLAYAKKANSKP